jgi:hypothetical protein
MSDFLCEERKENRVSGSEPHRVADQEIYNHPMARSPDLPIQYQSDSFLALFTLDAALLW